MFIIQAGSKKYIWNNSIEDDFLRFLPDHFYCKPEDILAYFVSKVDERTLKAHLGLGSDHVHSIGDLGSIDLKVVAPGIVTPATLKPGDDDPLSPGQKVNGTDPRTKDQVGPPRITTVDTLHGKPLAGWPYESGPKGELIFTGNKVASQ